MTSGRFLGIDYGAKRIGLAVSDERRVLAFPKIILDNNENALAKLKEIIKTENISELVIGESVDFAGKPNAVAAEIDAFVLKLKKFELPVHSQKEFLTSVEARRLQGSKDKVDASAAALILQRYLDKVN